MVRGVLPFAIVWLANPAFSFFQIIDFVFHPTADIQKAVDKSQSLLLLAGGVYLFMVFLGWLFLEEKKYAFLVEEFVHKQSIWFYAFASLFFTGVVYFSIKINPILALSAAVGSTAFFITDGFKHNAEAKEKELLSEHIGALSKILYLEILDATFSIRRSYRSICFHYFYSFDIFGKWAGCIYSQGNNGEGNKYDFKICIFKKRGNVFYRSFGRQ